MREAPSDSNESLRNQYEQLLARSIQLAKSYEAISGDEDDEDFDGDAREQAADGLEHSLRQRVEILKKLENLRTIEDAYPRIKVDEDDDREKVDATDVIKRLLNGEIGIDDVKAAGKRIMGPERTELTNEELQAFRQACADVAKQYGYAFESERAYVTLRKGDMQFSLKHFAFPSEFGILAPSRISVISSWREGQRADSGMFFDDGQWVNACTDLEMQKELDRVIALFR